METNDYPTLEEIARFTDSIPDDPELLRLLAADHGWVSDQETDNSTRPRQFASERADTLSFASAMGSESSPHLAAQVRTLQFTENETSVKEQIALHCFGSTDRSFELRLYLLPDPTDPTLTRVELTISPAPVQHDLLLQIEFPNALVHSLQLSVPPEIKADRDAEPRPLTRSRLSVSLVRSTVEFGTYDWDAAAWPPKIVLRK